MMFLKIINNFSLAYIRLITLVMFLKRCGQRTINAGEGGDGGNQGRHRGELTLIEEGNGGNQVDSRKMTSTLTK